LQWKSFRTLHWFARFTIIPEISIRRELHVGLLKRINLDGFELSFDYYLFYKKRNVFTTAIEAFIDILIKTRLLSHSDNIIGRVQKACD